MAVIEAGSSRSYVEVYDTYENGEVNLYVNGGNGSAGVKLNAQQAGELVTAISEIVGFKPQADRSVEGALLELVEDLGYEVTEGDSDDGTW